LIVVDTSTLVGAVISPDGVPRLAVQLARDQDIFALSEAVLDELIDVLHRPRLARFVLADRREELLCILISESVWFEPDEQVTDCRDANDNKFLELAQASSASIIVSSDNDLLVLDPWRHTRILQPAAYVALMQMPPSRPHT